MEGKGKSEEDEVFKAAMILLMMGGRSVFE